MAKARGSLPWRIVKTLKSTDRWLALLGIALALFTSVGGGRFSPVVRAADPAFRACLQVAPGYRGRLARGVAGALVTAALFDFGKFAIGWYVTSRSVATTYGAATSVIVVLISVCYSAQILLLGIELTHAYSVEATERQASAKSKTEHKADVEAAP